MNRQRRDKAKEAASKRRWRLAHPERVRAQGRAWCKKNKAKRTAYMREWRKKNEAHLMAYEVAYAPARVARRVARRKAVLGRVCRDCGQSDAEVSWSSTLEACGACLTKAYRNGRCKACGTVRIAHRVRFGVKSKGTHAVRFCPACKDKRDHKHHVPSLALTLWDMLWTMDLTVEPFRIVWQDVARVTQANQRASLRQLSRMQAWIKRLDVGYEIVAVEGRTASTFNPYKLREVLRPLVEVPEVDHV